jgi:transaldolase
MNVEIYIDSAKIAEIKKWLDMGVLDGITTNPSIMYKDGVYDIEKGAKEIAKLIHPRPLSVEVTTNDLNEMLAQARRFAGWATNVAVKIPQENQFGVPCYGVMRQLETEGIKVNATVALSLGQVILSAKTGATYISIFAGRVGDEGGNASQVIADSVDWLERWNYKSRIIVGSIRCVADVLQAAMAGAHIITIPPQFLAKMADHNYTKETVKQFIDDAAKTLEMIKQAKKS